MGWKIKEEREEKESEEKESEEILLGVVFEF